MNNKEERINNNIRSKWSKIGDDVLCSILHRLSPIYYLQAQTVCLSWQSTISRLIANKHAPPSPKIPLVLFNTCQRNRSIFLNLSTKSAFSNIANSSSSSTTKSQSKIVCRGTIQGWMIMVEVFYISHRSRVFFVNLVTKTKVYTYDIIKIKASMTPIDPNCVVVRLFTHPGLLAFSFMFAKSWTKIQVDERVVGINFTEVEILGRKLYTLTDSRFNCRTVCDLRTKPIKPQVLAKLPATRRVSIPCKVGGRFPSSFVLNGQDDVFKSLAIDASSEELLLVYLLFNSKCVCHSIHASPPNITRIIVFKLDNIISGKLKWTEVRNIKNHMLYVDRKRSLVVSNVDVHGPKENYIYFAYQDPFKRITSIEPWEGMRIGRYCKSDRSTNYCKFEFLLNHIS